MSYYFAKDTCNAKEFKQLACCLLNLVDGDFDDSIDWVNAAQQFDSKIESTAFKTTILDIIERLRDAATGAILSDKEVNHAKGELSAAGEVVSMWRGIVPTDGNSIARKASEKKHYGAIVRAMTKKLDAHAHAKAAVEAEKTESRKRKADALEDGEEDGDEEDE